MLCPYLIEMIDPNLGFDPNAPGVQKIYVKPYSERYAYEINPYVYGEYAGPLRDLILGQYQRLVKMVNNLNQYGLHITVNPFNMERFSWSLEFKVDIIDGYGCHAPVTFMERYAPKLLILTDNELAHRVKEAFGAILYCAHHGREEEEEEEMRRRQHTGREIDRHPRRDRPGGQNYVMHQP